ncbi:uncharacterized protein METZ01_LOCUS130536 [marine metagenome]|uniref:Uncharacterized protein n=1 Tax=marine metagenome TaxID=408172 RepID=A0A381YM66_9ZZZZ
MGIMGVPLTKLVSSLYKVTIIGTTVIFFLF